MVTQEAIYRVELAVAFDEAVERTIHEMSEQGFGVLTWVDLKDKLVERLGVEIRSYVIMGVFDPDVAQRALESDIEAGLVIASNVAIYERAPGHAVVAALRPKGSFSYLKPTDALGKLALETDARIRAALQKLVSD